MNRLARHEIGTHVVVHGFAAMQEDLDDLPGPKAFWLDVYINASVS